MKPYICRVSIQILLRPTAYSQHQPLLATTTKHTAHNKKGQKQSHSHQPSSGSNLTAESDCHTSCNQSWSWQHGNVILLIWPTISLFIWLFQQAAILSKSISLFSWLLHQKLCINLAICWWVFCQWHLSLVHVLVWFCLGGGGAMVTKFQGRLHLF